MSFSICVISFAFASKSFLIPAKFFLRICSPRPDASFFSNSIKRFITSSLFLATSKWFAFKTAFISATVLYVDLSLVLSSSALLAASSKATTPLNFFVFIMSSTFFSASKILSLFSNSNKCKLINLSFSIL